MIWIVISVLLSILILVELVIFFRLILSSRPARPLEVISKADSDSIKYNVVHEAPFKMPSPEEVVVNFVGSKETGTYHKNNCRFSKLIFPEYRMENSNESYFVKNGFVPCKICILSKKAKKKSKKVKN